MLENVEIILRDSKAKITFDSALIWSRYSGLFIAFLITDVDMKLLLFHVSSLEEYRNFPFIVYCFVAINKITE